MRFGNTTISYLFQYVLDESESFLVGNFYVLLFTYESETLGNLLSFCLIVLNDLIITSYIM